MEVARQGDALKSALLDSVSHDLRTPLSAIRAAAGNLMDPDVALEPEEQRAVADSIDVEAQRLSRLVRNMLDLGRIEGGALHPSLELYDLADLIDPVVERIAPTLAPGQLEVRDRRRPARSQGRRHLRRPDPDQPARERGPIRGREADRGFGEAVSRTRSGWSSRTPAPASRRPPCRTFSSGSTAAPRRQGSRSEGGSGIGLAVVRGLAEAMGGSAWPGRARSGGLEVIVRLQVE